MYVILVNEDNTLTTTVKERIMQRSKLVDEMWFLVPPEYKGYGMEDFTVSLEYLLPVSKRYCNEFLQLNGTYNGHLKYVLPFDTMLTAEPGKIEIQLTFALAEMTNSGQFTQRVRKVSPTTVEIIPISAWSDIIPDSALSALDQRIIKTDAQIKALDEFLNLQADTKADNLIFDNTTKELQLTANGKEIGKRVIIECGGEFSEDGVPVVDFSDIKNSDNSDSSEDEDNVVEF